MADSREIFERKIFKIEGVEGYLLVRNDGRILTGKVNTGRQETLASMMVISHMDCEAVRTAMGFTHFNFLMLTGRKNEMMFVFPLKNYFLGILYGKREYNAVFVKKIQRFIQEITTKKAGK